MRLAVLLVLGILLGGLGCGKKSSAARAQLVIPGESKEAWPAGTGKGDGYHGRRTASGERFDRDKLTAAHFNLTFWVTGSRSKFEQ